jgi:hypothetical protein
VSLTQLDTVKLQVSTVSKQTGMHAACEHDTADLEILAEKGSCRLRFCLLLALCIVLQTMHDILCIAYYWAAHLLHDREERSFDGLLYSRHVRLALAAGEVGAIILYV